MAELKHFINGISHPTVILTAILFIYPFIFPPSDWFEKWNKRFKLNFFWTKKGLMAVMLIFLAFFIIGVQDENAKLILLKPDNVPIVGLLMLVHFFLWLSMNQGIKNDKLIEAGEKPNEYSDPEDKVLVWPDLVYVELISLVLFMAFLLVWSIGLEAPLEQPADPTTAPNPSKAPWYFLGLQEMLVYFDPWLAGVVFPTLMIVGLMAIPYIDFNKEGKGHFSFKQRRIALSIFLFGWLWLWINLILIGTFLRGPNWNLFGPFEYWDPHKLEVLTNINLSELIYIKLLSKGLPENILLREIFGFLLVFGYFLIMPPLLAKTLFKKLHQSLGNFKFGVFIFLLLTLILLPLKMYLRWILNLKYIIAIPEFFFNI